MKTPTRRGDAARKALTALTAPTPPELLAGPTHDELVRAHAYRRYEQRGCVEGHALEDWLAAEAEVASLAVGEGAALQPAA